MAVLPKILSEDMEKTLEQLRKDKGLAGILLNLVLERGYNLRRSLWPSHMPKVAIVQPADEHDVEKILCDITPGYRRVYFYIPEVRCEEFGFDALKEYLKKKRYEFFYE